MASREGIVKVLGRTGVEIVLEEEAGLATVADPPSHLVFPTPTLLVGITAGGGILAWDFSDKGRRCGHLPCLVGPEGAEEGVTAVHCPRTPIAASADAAGSVAVVGHQHYLYIGLESGGIRVVQVYPTVRLSGYVLRSRDMASGAPEELQAPGGGDGDGGGALGAVTAITSSGKTDGGALVLIGHRYGAIVLWDFVRRKRLALHGLSVAALVNSKRDGGGRGADVEDREVTSLAFNPGMDAFAAGFSCGCYAVFPSAASRELGSPRWVSEVGDDGLFSREGPTIVRTPVSLVQWVGVRQGQARAWGLLVAGGVEIEEGEEPDGVSLLVTSSDPASGRIAEQSFAGGGRTKKHSAALLVFETAVFVPYAIGQERLSCVHAVVVGGRSEDGGSGGGGGAVRAPSAPSATEGFDAQYDRGRDMKGEGEECVDVTEELVVMGLVDWTEEVRGTDGRLHFRHASSVKVCPVQTSPYVALLQLTPGRLGSHLSGFAPVTKLASTPLLSSSTILNFVACLGAAEKTWPPNEADLLSSSVLRGGGLRWAESVPVAARDEALCTSEMLVVGHADGTISFWECCGPASRSDGVFISEGRMEMRNVPAAASLLGSLPAAELAGGIEGATSAVTALDVWVERDHVAAAECDACWVAVGFVSGEVAVLVLSNSLRINRRNGGKDGGIGVDGGGSTTPLAAKPMVISDVKMNDGADAKDATEIGWKRLARWNAQSAEVESQYEDKELEAAIAEARAEALTIQASGGETSEDETSRSNSTPQAKYTEKAPIIEEQDVGTRTLKLHGELPQATHKGGFPEIAVERTDSSSSEALPPNDAGRAKATTQEVPYQQGPPGASLVQLALRLHVHAIRCVALSFDTSASALVVVVADAEGVVSITDVATGSASLVPMRAPQVRPCFPSITVGPLPYALTGGIGRGGRRQQSPVKHGAAGALFVLLEGWLNVFDLALRDPIDLAEIPGFSLDHGIDDRHGDDNKRSNIAEASEERAWIFCVDERGVPLTPYASTTLSTFTPSPAYGGVVPRGVGAPSGEQEATAEGGNRDAIAAGGQEQTPSSQRHSQTTIWVSPSVSRSALDGYHEHELQMLSSLPSARSFFVVVRGPVAIVLAVNERDPMIVSAFHRRPSARDPNVVAAFKGKSGAELVVKSRVEMPPADGRGPPPSVDHAGVCVVAAGAGGGVEGKMPRRGCLVATDISGFVTGLLLPSLSPVFRDRISLGGESGGRRPVAAGAPAQASLCNLMGELTICNGRVRRLLYSVRSE